MPQRRLFGEAELRRVGRRVRSAREALNLSQAALAQLAGVSDRAIREIEAGRANPTLATITAVVHALGLTLDDLVAEARRAPPPPDVTRAADAPDGDVELTRSLPAPRMRARLVRLGEGGNGPVPAGYLFAHVLRGQVEVVLDGEDSVLRRGDSLHARPGALRGWTARGGGAVAILVEECRPPGGAPGAPVLSERGT